MLKKSKNRIILALSCILFLLIALLTISITLSSGRAYANPPANIMEVMTSNVNWYDLNERSKGVKESKLDVIIEEQLTDEMGDPISGKGLYNIYRLIPSHVYLQDPTITVYSGSAPCELFVYIEDPVGDRNIEDTPTVEDQLHSNGWVDMPQIKGLYKFKGIVDAQAADQIVKVSDNFKVISNPDQAIIDELSDREHHITFTAYAFGVGCTDQAGYYAAQTGDVPWELIKVVGIFLIFALLYMTIRFFERS